LKIITVNLPQATIDRMKVIVEKFGLYPSRSELVRVAVREFLVKELQHLEQYQKYAETGEDPPRRNQGQTIDMRTIRFARSLTLD